MKIALFFLLAAFALAASSPVPTEPIKILGSDFDIEPEGTYKSEFETKNTIVREEVEVLKLVKNEDGKEVQVIVVKGSYSYLDPEGHPITVTFFANEIDFNEGAGIAEGADLPVALIV